MHHRRTIALLLAALILASAGLLWTPQTASAGIYNADTEVTYKEYWVPHSQFTGGCDSHNRPNGGSWYLEPWPCQKTVQINLPDDFSQALKVEIYLDLWRNHNSRSARFKVNGGPTHTPNVGSNWSRTPWIGEIPKNQLVQGTNELLFWHATGGYHIHDIAIRIYFDAGHPLRTAQGVPITAPTGALVSIQADNDSFSPQTGGNLLVNSDRLVLTANTTSNARFVEFHGYYYGYDEDNDGVFLDWHNLGRNNWHPGGTDPKATGGTINHIGTVLAPTPGTYHVTWNLPHIINQDNVKFKIRIVDDNYVVREAAGGISTQFALQRTKSVVSYLIPNFQDAVLYHGGSHPEVITRTLTLPADLSVYDEIYLIGAFWQNPWIRINNQTQQRAFTSGQDVWALSVRKYSGSQFNWWQPGANSIAYLYSSGFGQFIEKPGPMVVLKQTSPDSTPPVISNQNCATGSTSQPRATISWQTNEPATSRVDYGPTNALGQFVQANTLKTDHVVVLTGVDTQQPLYYKITATDIANNSKVTAVFTCPAFTVDQFVLTTNVVGEGQVTANPPGPAHLAGAPVSLAATAAEGWQFAGWTPPVHEPVWLDPQWRYRFPITVSANGHARLDKPVELDLNFTALLNAAGANGAFAVDSLRVVEVGADGATLDPLVPFQFDAASNFNASTNAAGKLIFLLKGATGANATRTYHVYFEVAGHSIAPVVFDNQVSYIDNVIHQEQASYQIQTLNATYYYHKQGAGFSSLVDVNGNDWISYRPTGGAAGHYRGIPNAVYISSTEQYFQPGKTTSASEILYAGPLKLTIRSVSNNNMWEALWEIYPHYAKMTMVRRDPDYKYWVLYEGTPGGLLEPNSDIVVRSSDSEPQLASTIWPDGDIPGEEWVYFGDPNKGRSLYVINHQDDTLWDTYYPMNGQMTVFGFGRKGSSTTSYLTQTPAYFTIGLMDTIAKAEAEPIIRNAYKDLVIQSGAVTRQVDAVGSAPSPANPISVVMVADRALTANFVPAHHTLTVNQIGSGTVTIDPQRADYDYGELVTLTALPAAGWSFNGWSGDLSGTDAQAMLTVNGNKSVTATFAPLAPTLTINTNGNGTVTVNPAKEVYQYKEQVTLTATPATGWIFTGWSGDLSGDANPVTIELDSNKSVIANFAQTTGVLTTQVVGQGQVLVNPLKAFYAPGEEVALLAVPDLDWQFAGWSGALSGESNPAILVMNGNQSVIATFVEAPITGEIKSDDFNHCAYSTNVWTWIDPLGDATAPQATGEEILLAVPGGVPHDLWRDGIQAPHLVQQVDDQDFDVMAQFNSAVSERIQLQGLLFKQDDSRAVRVNFQREGSTTYLFAGVLRGAQSPQARAKIALAGEAPLAVRVQRADNSWTIWYRSGAGEWVTEEALSFTHALVVDQVGLFVGNASVSGNPAPAHTAVVDYFVNLAQPLAGDDPLANVLPVEVVGQGEVTRNRECGNPVELTATPASGWEFERWEARTPQGVQNLGDANPLRVEFTKGMTITAVFEPVDPVSYQLNVTTVGQGTVTKAPDKANYTPGETVTLTAEAQPGWHFVEWSGDVTSTAAQIQVTMEKNLNVQALFVLESQETFSLTTTVVGEGTVTKQPDKPSYNPGETVTLTAEAQPGWHFVEWSGDVTGTAAQVQVTVQKDLSIQATFTADPQSHFTVATSVIGNGSVVLTPTKALYEPGEVVTIEATAGPGWVFVEWSGNLDGAANPQSLTVDANKNVTARFDATQAGLIVTSPHGKVKIEPEKAFYQVGDTVTLTAEPDDGWEFVEWQIHGAVTAAAPGTSENPLTITIDGQQSYEPKFQVQGAEGSVIVYLPVVSQP